MTGTSYGDHEITNYLHGRFCATDPTTDLCRIVIFNDDGFSHWLFFTGFVLTNAVLMVLQVLFPWRTSLARGDVGLLIINGLFIGLGVFANLAFEQIGLDLYVVALLALLAIGLLWLWPATIAHLLQHSLLFGLNCHRSVQASVWPIK